MSEQDKNPFWVFSLAFYGQPGVAAACITLQDESGVDVNVMLYCLWLASQDRAITAAEAGQIDARVNLWRAKVVVPLRVVRRVMKDFPPPFDGPAAQAMRNKVKAVELESERLQQQALYDLKPADAWGSGSSGVAEAAQRNLAAYSSHLNAKFDPAAESAMVMGLEALMARLEADSKARD